MKKKLIWLYYAIDFVLRNNLKLYKKKYCKRKVITNEEASMQLGKLLMLGEPFAVGRFGLFEIAAMRMYEFHKKTKYELVMSNIYNCAGFFPNDIALGYKFLDVMKEALSQMDILGASRQLCENYFINSYMKSNSVVAENFGLFEICQLNNCWTKCLEGKKVLVVTPFVDSVEYQYSKKNLLFPGTNILPDFELITYRSIMTIGDIRDDRFETWFDALDYMRDEILMIDFDVALLGCGAYGFPLAAEIKKAGKQAIHMGGILQILFGIMGKRWDGTRTGKEIKIREDIAKYYNDSWIYPIEQKPDEANKVEYGPYWK